MTVNYHPLCFRLLLLELFAQGPPVASKRERRRRARLQRIHNRLNNLNGELVAKGTLSTSKEREMAELRERLSSLRPLDKVEAFIAGA